ncbi:uncharacterized protein LOC117107068 [Anneissia japonica]|uniref:uncharacterized protein LOC117107068 n=1 Tax=Anneissia japonica TaxID=1529436 RepID=UPI001425A861|nr:uncharacterized protein LOC117107068 [Anneissia japonica]
MDGSDIDRTLVVGHVSSTDELGDAATTFNLGALVSEQEKASFQVAGMEAGALIDNVRQHVAVQDIATARLVTAEGDTLHAATLDEAGITEEALSASDMVTTIRIHPELVCSLESVVTSTALNVPGGANVLYVNVPNLEHATPGQPLNSQGSVVYAQALANGQQAILTSNITETKVNGEAPKKRKGGWPKGRKRKRDPLKDANAPKAPTTAYVFFSNEQRLKVKKENPDMSFTEITKLLGNQWSSLNEDEKKKYIENAESDKRRYINDLKAYQQTDLYQMLMKKQAARKFKNLVGVDPDALEPDIESTLLSGMNMEDDDPSDLFCKTCDQYFSSMHNKKEHLYGKQHLLNLTGKLCEVEKELFDMENSNQQEAAMTSLESNTEFTEIESVLTPKRILPAPINLEQFKDEFIELNAARELEMRILRKRQEEMMELNMILNRDLKELQNTICKQEEDFKNLQTYGAALQRQLDGLRMIPTLFGVINF